MAPTRDPRLAWPRGTPPHDAAGPARRAPEGAATPRPEARQQRHRQPEPTPRGMDRAPARQDSPTAAFREIQLPAGMLPALSGAGTTRERDGGCPGVSSHG